MISEFSIADDFNRMDPVREYHAHQARVTEIRVDRENKWVLSAAKDKYVTLIYVKKGVFDV